MSVMFKRILFSILIIICAVNIGFAQTTSFSASTRYNFYSNDTVGELLVNIGSGYVWKNITITSTVDNDTIGLWKGVPKVSPLPIPVYLKLQPKSYIINIAIESAGKQIASISTPLSILRYKPNEVKVDRLTGGLIANKLPIFPFGFYCYSPVYPTLPEEEVVKGFNMISPYQKVVPETLKDRQSYMDRCAELGMKVHYNLLSVSGGGGVGSQIEGVSGDSLQSLLKEEINTFMNHPALLAWYISDEPFPNRISPDSLIKIYSLIKELDPWHPVSIVFMTPFTATAKKYADAMDIVMADPYPVPDMQPTYNGTVAKSLRNEFGGKKPVWIATQAFGGGEIWRREPTANEVRIMTYTSIINGATGIQYFIRHGLNSYPKSTATWAECGKMAMEIQELTPWLLSDESHPSVKSSSSDVVVMSRLYKGRLMVMAANKSNSTRRVDYSVSTRVNGKAKVLFENRNVNISGNSFSDYLPAYGTQVYLIDTKTDTDTIKAYNGNLQIDPGIEDSSSPGVPTACYAWNTGDRGATYFTDTREQVEGIHSIRLTTPKPGESIRLRFFPINVKKGNTYYISIWAKGDPTSGTSSTKKRYFELSLGNYGAKKFVLTDKWKQYFCRVYIPFNKNVPAKLNATLTMSSQGTGWFDMIQVFESVDITRSINPEVIEKNLFLFK